jgi:hypothetical protein
MFHFCYFRFTSALKSIIMDLANRMIQCQQCLKREFNPKNGVVCSLTHAKPAFEGKACPDFDEDSKVDKERARQIGAATYRTDKEKALKNAPRQPITAKMVFTVIGGILLVIIVIAIRVAIRYS